MKKDILEKTMLDLVACRLSPEKWITWWDNNHTQLTELLNAGEYLRIKPKLHDFYWVPILTSQKGAIQYLEKHKIPFEYSAIYQKNYEDELNEYCRKEENKRKTIVEELKAKQPQLFDKYPRFSNSLKNAFYLGDRIENGVDKKTLSTNPNCIPIDIMDFFQVVSVITMEGIHIDYSSLRSEMLCGREYIVLGEFWKDADGDLLLIQLDNPFLPTVIYCYCRSINKVKKLSNSIDELMENKFSHYNNVNNR